MTVLLTIAAIVIVLFVIIFLHELGHFLAAKAARVSVEEFGIGFPPRLFGIRFRGTIYSLNLIPIGAFVKMAGEAEAKIPGSLYSKPAWVRFLVSGAGPATNITLALVLFTTSFMFPTVVPVLDQGILVREVAPASPAEKAGIQPGDRILSIAGQPVKTLDEAAQAIHGHKGQQIQMVLLRGDQRLSVSLIPRPKPPPGQGPTGATLSYPTTVQRFSLTQALARSGRLFIHLPVILKDFFTSVAREPGKSLVGPVGAAQLTGEVVKYGLQPMVGLAGSLSLGLGIFNLFPIPPLDGGGMLIALGEGLSRRGHLSPRLRQIIYAGGTLLLISIILVVTYNDIARLIQGESILPW
ncbi:MAG TPA: site-2 protease family protein [Dehalococcoidia bacterium]|nr:site-2 protease family protein [Dehalococcoidia bacterium]